MELICVGVMLYSVYMLIRFIHNDITKLKNGCRIGGTLMFSSIGAYRENFLIAYNLFEKEDMAV